MKPPGTSSLIACPSLGTIRPDGGRAVRQRAPFGRYHPMDGQAHVSEERPCVISESCSWTITRSSDSG